MKLDHNQAVKALREGKTINVYNKVGRDFVFNARYRMVNRLLKISMETSGNHFGAAEGSCFMLADHFTIEEEEEKGIELSLAEYSNRLYNKFNIKLAEPLLGGSFVTFMDLLCEELDKRYERKK